MISSEFNFRTIMPKQIFITFVVCSITSAPLNSSATNLLAIVKKNRKEIKGNYVYCGAVQWVKCWLLLISRTHFSSTVAAALMDKVTHTHECFNEMREEWTHSFISFIFHLDTFSQCYLWYREYVYNQNMTTITVTLRTKLEHFFMILSYCTIKTATISRVRLNMNLT